MLALRVWRGDDFHKLLAKKKILKIGQKLTELESKDWFGPLTAFNPIGPDAWQKEPPPVFSWIKTNWKVLINDFSSWMPQKCKFVYIKDTTFLDLRF